MKLKALIPAFAAMMLTVPASQAQNFFNDAEPETLINLGARIGFNVANQTSSDNGKIFSLDGWGTGFDAGVVCDLNIRDFIAIQPGFFFESRSNNYSYVYPNSIVPEDNFTHEFGHTRHYTFKIPVLASLRLNPMEDLRWSIDFGPYISFGLGGTDFVSIPENPSEEGLRDYRKFKDGYYDSHDSRNKVDFGFKMGTGIQYASHYYFGIHYEAGATNVYKLYGGRHKAWTFTIGYDF